jgi:SAM-dependent methyltransferase
MRTRSVFDAAVDDLLDQTIPRSEDPMRDSPLPQFDEGPSRPNRDERVIEGFDDEWSRFDQQGMGAGEKTELFAAYFAIFPWDALPPGGGEGADIGCGSGRWAQMVAPRVGTLHLVDASSDALEVARRNLAGAQNTRFCHASVDALPFEDGTLDFAYSLGVLHHVPDTAQAVRAVAAKLKPGAPLLLYLYYAFDNRPLWFKTLWRASDGVRQVVSRLPLGARYFASQALALSVYWPLARSAKVLASVDLLPPAWPLAYYRDKSFYTLRTDALDRFGTRLEQRFTRAQIEGMMSSAGLGSIRFSDAPPYWCAVGIKR